MKRWLPVLAFLTVALVGVCGAAFVWIANQRAEEILFEAVTEEASNRIKARVSRLLLLVETTAALFEAKAGRVTATDFGTYMDSLRLAERHAGIAGLGYAAFVRQDERPSLVRAYRRAGGGGFEIWPTSGEPESGEAYAAPVVLFHATDGVAPPTGYDAFSEGARRAAIERTIAAREPRATEPIQLARDLAPPQPGFVVFAPVYAANFGIDARAGDPQLPTGFAFGGFRTGELLRAALDVPPLQPVHLRVFDADDPGRTLYEYGDPASDRFGRGYGITHGLSVAGQDWRLEFAPTAAFQPSSARWLTLLLGAASILLGLVGAFLLRAQAHAQHTAERLAAASQENLLQKELMLQEMKHRIKNAIARILAIARQTAAGASDVESFTKTFTKRLQAMSNAQDMLTRSKWQRADLRDLITQELTQVFGPAFDPARTEGPPVEIDEKTVQALGLTFHELATNALKYADVTDGAPDIAVTWRLAQDGSEMAIDWRERSAFAIEAPPATGFGTRLIDANIRHDLGGSIERAYLPDGLRIRLTVPLSARSRAKPRPAAPALEA